MKWRYMAGEPEFLFDDGQAQSEAEQERTDAIARKDMGTQPSAVAMVVQAGDVVLMDCKISHFGSANRCVAGKGASWKFKSGERERGRD